MRRRTSFAALALVLLLAARPAAADDDWTWVLYSIALPPTVASAPTTHEIILTIWCWDWGSYTPLRAGDVVSTLLELDGIEQLWTEFDLEEDVECSGFGVLGVPSDTHLIELRRTPLAPAVPGTYNLRYCIENTCQGSDAQLEVLPRPAPDLQISGLALRPNRLPLRAPFTAEFEVRNVGDAAALAGADLSLSIDGTLVDQAETPRLEPGERLESTLSFFVPTLLHGARVEVDDEFGVSVCVGGGLGADPNVDGRESGANALRDNCRQATLTVSANPPRPRLVATELTAVPRRVEVGRETELRFTVRNDGEMDSSTASLYFYASSDDVLSPEDTLVETTSVAPLAEGATAFGSLTWQPPFPGNTSFRVGACFVEPDALADPDRTKNAIAKGADGCAWDPIAMGLPISQTSPELTEPPEAGDNGTFRPLGMHRPREEFETGTLPDSGDSPEDARDLGLLCATSRGAEALGSDDRGDFLTFELATAGVVTTTLSPADELDAELGLAGESVNASGPGGSETLSLLLPEGESVMSVGWIDGGGFYSLSIDVPEVPDIGGDGFAIATPLGTLSTGETIVPRELIGDCDEADIYAFEIADTRSMTFELQAPDSDPTDPTLLAEGYVLRVFRDLGGGSREIVGANLRSRLVVDLEPGAYFLIVRRPESLPNVLYRLVIQPS